MLEVLFQRLQQYASRHKLQLAEKLGSGIHGLVHVGLKQESVERSALKVRQAIATYVKEQESYRRLRQAAVNQIQGFNVPQLLDSDDKLLVIEMTIVTKPYLLDFAGVALDRPAEFSADVWRDWEDAKLEQFGAQWTVIKRVISALELYGIYLTDVSPGNIAWE